LTTRGKTRQRALEETQAFAVGHHVRFEALSIFNERIASPKEVAEVTGASLSKAGHHVKELLDAGCIELVRIEPRGGSAEHFYRAIKRPEITDEEWEAMPDTNRREIAATVFRNLIAEGLSSIRASKMSADRFLRLSWKSVNLDAEGRKAAADEQRGSLERLQTIEAESANRMAGSGEEGVSTVIAVLGFTRSRNIQLSEDSRVPGEV
jgi:DNA-binding transcriptional ArsR family regulator